MAHQRKKSYKRIAITSSVLSQNNQKCHRNVIFDTLPAYWVTNIGTKVMFHFLHNGTFVAQILNITYRPCLVFKVATAFNGTEIKYTS